MESFIKVPTDFGANSALWWAGGMAKPLAIFSDSCAYTLYLLLLISVFRQVAMMQMIRVAADALLPK